ncbi:MAG: hypothetical protein OK456_01220 [Thaumarchaeota archaeon]|nr:hypothetical protein [Nitrososphaerota archaeon]
MTNSRTTRLASMAVLSLLLMGIAPVFAQTSQSTSTTTTTTATTTSTSTHPSPASVLISLAQRAQNYTEHLVTIAQGDGVNVSQAQGLIAQGSASLTLAQNELGTNNTQAAKDALQAMSYFKGAAESIRDSVQSNRAAELIADLQAGIQRLTNQTNRLQTIVTTACALPNASAALCAGANANLANVTSDLSQATSMIAALPNPPTNSSIQAIITVLQGAMTHLQQAYSDVGQLAVGAREQRAIEQIQNTLLPGVTQLEQRIQNSNLSSGTIQQLETQLSQAQTLLNTAIGTFQSGNFTGGVQQVQQAMQEVKTVLGELLDQTLAAMVQNHLQPRLTAESQAAQRANLSASVAQEVQTQLSQAQTLINGAIQAFQSGNVSSGIKQSAQASALLTQAELEIIAGPHTTTMTTTTTTSA